jgi:hypothetical protein
VILVTEIVVQVHVGTPIINKEISMDNIEDLAMCVDTGDYSVRKYGIYKVTQHSNASDCYLIKDDRGVLKGIYKSRFITLTKILNNCDMSKEKVYDG